MTDRPAGRLAIEEAASVSGRILDEVERAVVGKRPVLELLFLALLADGHVLIEDVPGLAKTLMARAFATVTGLRFARVQFTPDLMPMDITGSPVLDRASGQPVFRPGPVFTNLLLADEINRAPAKTQAALLEAMQERQVTAEGITRPLERPFLVIATQNPIEYEGTYPLPEAQLDRFLARIRVGYPSRDDEWEILSRRLARTSDEVVLAPVADPATLRALQQSVEAVHVSEAIGFYIVDLVEATRRMAQVEVGASPRGALALLKLARARALMQARDFVTPDDVKQVAVPALGHRLVLHPELWVQNVQGAELVQRCLDEVPTPPTSPGP